MVISTAYFNFYPSSPMKIIITFFSLAFILALIPKISSAQFGTGNVHLPYESQKASVMQTIGLTEISLTYHRPGVKGRKIWGELVPFDNGVPIPWRGGANENTTISFSTDVTIEGKPLAAGTYGLHFIPAEKEWIVIFSKNYTSWGSFSYDQKEDALRVTVNPQMSEMEEYLKYEFANPQKDKVLAELHWEKLKVGFSIGVNTHEVVLASIRRELRNTPGFSDKGFNSAAMYCVNENINYEEAMQWASRAVSADENFNNLETLAQLQRKTGKANESDKTMQKALSIAKPLELHGYGRQLIKEKKIDEAMKIFEYNLKTNPDQWFVYAGMARGYEAKGKMKEAIENMKIALAKAPENSKANVSGILNQWESKQN